MWEVSHYFPLARCSLSISEVQQQEAERRRVILCDVASQLLGTSSSSSGRVRALALGKHIAPWSRNGAVQPEKITYINLSFGGTNQKVQFQLHYFWGIHFPKITSRVIACDSGNYMKCCFGYLLENLISVAQKNVMLSECFSY